jgi:hypothetical protein
MNQALYEHMNNKRKIKKKKTILAYRLSGEKSLTLLAY